MKRKYLCYGLMIILIMCASGLLVSCSVGGGEDEETTTEENGGDGEEASAAAISVEASESSLNPGDSTNVTATVYDASGHGLSGALVIFSLSNPALAYITSPRTTSSSGQAVATFTARDLQGMVEGTATAGSVSNADAPLEIVIGDESAASINLTVNPAGILVGGTATVTAEVLDDGGNPVPDGTAVAFNVNSFYGTVSPSSTTHNGFATATFKAANESGTATIYATSGSATASIDIVIQQAPAAAIEFLSAEPQCIAIKETGGTELSVIKFVVLDSIGNPVSDVSVHFVMDGPNGGEYIDPSGDGTPSEIDVSTDVEGIAQVILHSGYVAGPVTISGTIDISGTPMTARSSVVSIGGGVPSAKRFSVASTILNLPGLAYNNRTADISAYLADRFGNYNVLEGTTVSFACEVGLAIDTSQVTLDENGLATVVVRTQWPVDPDVSGPEDVQPELWEIDLQGYLALAYGYNTTANPRDGLCAVMVYVKGEEHFDDTNGNGIYDSEPFLDTYDDPFVDYNDNGDYDGPASIDPEELYVDSGSNGVWDGKNGSWDSDKQIFANFHLLVTGSPMILFNKGTFNVADGGSELIKVIVCDRNLNQLPPGSKVTISSDVGKLVGTISREYADSNAVGPTMDGHLALIEYVFAVCDSSPGDSAAPEAGSITVSVDWEGLKTEYSIYGVVD